MKSSCIDHPAREPLILIRKWQLEFCEGKAVAAALMSFFEYWHNIKLETQKQNRKLIEVANAHGELIEIDTSLYQWHTNEDLVNGIIHIAKSKNTITAALTLLEEKRAISIHQNPNPKFNFDKTRYFLFYPEICIQWLIESRSVKNDLSKVKNDAGVVKNDNGVVRNDPAITETTTETTTENIQEEQKTFGNDPLSDIFNGQGKISEKTGPVPTDQFFSNRNVFLAAFESQMERLPGQVEKEAIIGLAVVATANDHLWQTSITTSILNWTGKNKPPLSRIINVYNCDGDYKKALALEYDEPDEGYRPPGLNEDELATIIRRKKS